MILCPWSRDEAKNMTGKSFVKTSEDQRKCLRELFSHTKAPFEIKGVPLPPWVEKDRDSKKVQRGNWILQNVRKYPGKTTQWQTCDIFHVKGKKTHQAELRALLWTESCPQNLYEALTLSVYIGL